MERVQEEYGQGLSSLAPETLTDDNEQLTYRPNQYNCCLYVTEKLLFL
jgi:hypothetical protein